MASALDFDPGNSSYWSECHRDTVFGANYTAFATKFTDFSICHPVYDDTKMLKCVQHSLQSAMCSELSSPPSYFYPTGKTRASMPTEHWCEITQNTAPRLASSPRQNSHMQCQPRGRVYNVIYFSNHTWSMDIIALWNKETKQRLTDGSPNWLQTLQKSIPEAAWEKNQYLAREDTDRMINHVCPQYFKSKREDVTGQERGRNANVHLQPWDDKQFEFEVPQLEIVGLH